MTDRCRHDLPRVVLLTGVAAARGALGAMRCAIKSPKGV